MVSVTVISAGKSVSLAKGLPVTVTIPSKGVESATVAELKAEIFKKFPKVRVQPQLFGGFWLTFTRFKFYPSRQKLALKEDKRALADEKTLRDVGVVDGGEVTVKDLGPQIAWKTVFIIEYVSPLPIAF